MTAEADAALAALVAAHGLVLRQHRAGVDETAAAGAERGADGGADGGTHGGADGGADEGAGGGRSREAGARRATGARRPPATAAPAAAVDGAAAFSPDLRHRYLLLRRWGAGPLLGFLGLNPSTADERRLDPTLARVAGRARAAGFAGLIVANLFTLRSPHPAALRRAPDPSGPAAEAALDALSAAAAAILCGWGNGGLPGGRGAAALARLRASGRPLLHLGRTAKGAPRHPLYLVAHAPMQPWD